MKKGILSMLIIGTGMGIGLLATNPSITEAATFSSPTKTTANNPSQSINSAQNLTNSDIKKITPYIMVENNTYKLNPSINNTTISKDRIAIAKQMIATSNDQIKKEHLIINEATKEALPYFQFNNYAAYDRNYTVSRFWWGHRYYFTSNISVSRGARHFRNISSDLMNGSLFLDAVGDVTSDLNEYVFVTANVLSYGVSYVAGRYTDLASGLISYNRHHKHNQIYADVPYSLKYSFHILH